MALSNAVCMCPFDETSGNRTEDVVSEVLTETGTVGYASGLQSSNCAHFVGSVGNYLRKTSPSAFLIPVASDQDFAMEIWVKPHTNPSYVYRFVLQAKEDVTNPWGKFNLGWNSQSEFFVTCNTTVYGENIGIHNGTGFTLDAWHQIIVLYDHTNLTLDILVNTATYSGGTTSHAALPHQLAEQTTQTQFGQDSDGNFVCDGDVQYYRSWPHLITETEYTWLYNSGAGRTNAEVLAYDGGGGTVIPVIMHHLRQQGIS